MATTFEWGIANLERHAADDIVYTVHWTLSAHDGEHSASIYGSVGLEAPEEDAVIPYEDLTKEIVVGWTQDKLGEEKVEEMETALQTQLDNLKTPPSANGVPW